MELRWEKILVNRETGLKLKVLLRQMQPGKEDETMERIRREYMNTWFNREFYNSAEINSDYHKGVIKCLVAETEDDIAGMLVMKKYYPAEQLLELAGDAFDRKYRGYGLAELLIQYAMAAANEEELSAQYAMPVTFNKEMQLILENQGMIDTGFVMGGIDSSLIKNSYNTGRCIKHGQGVQVKAYSKHSAGTIYIPKELTDYTVKIYTKLGVTYFIADDSQHVPLTKVPRKSDISYRENKDNAFCAITIEQTGRDLEEKLDKLMTKYTLDKQCYTAFINCSEPGAVGAYELLMSKGFFFTGLKPLCGFGEQIIMHNPMGMPLYMEDYTLSGGFSEVRKDITAFYKRLA